MSQSRIDDSQLRASPIDRILHTDYMAELISLSNGNMTSDKTELPYVMDRGAIGRSYKADRPSNRVVNVPIKSTCNPDPVQSCVYRPEQHRRKNVREREDDQDTSRSPKRYCKVGHIGRISPVEVINISSDDGLSSLDESLPITRLGQRIPAAHGVPMDILSISSDDDLLTVDMNHPLTRLRQPTEDIKVANDSTDSNDSNDSNESAGCAGSDYSNYSIDGIDSDNGASVSDSKPLQSLLRTRPSRRKVPVDVSSVSSNDSMSNFIVADKSQSSSPPSAIRDIREEIRCAIRHIRQDDTAREKTAAQMDMLIAVLTAPTDLVITMKTGGGKRMLWMVPSVMDDDYRSIVVCPFVALLNEQYESTAATGLRCHKYCTSKKVPDDVQILFVQVEHCSSHSFAR